jgi:hypothetical protein
MLIALAELARALAELREAQARRAQQAAALSAAASLDDIAAAIDRASAALPVAVAFPGRSQPTRPAAAAGPATHLKPLGLAPRQRRFISS